MKKKASQLNSSLKWKLLPKYCGSQREIKEDPLMLFVFMKVQKSELFARQLLMAILYFLHQGPGRLLKKISTAQKVELFALITRCSRDDSFVEEI